MKSSIWLGATLIVLMCCSRSFAQGGGFFGGGVGFNPEVSVVHSGAVLDAQATVSADRKYVTLNVRATLSHLNSLVPFTFVDPGGGTLGGGGAGGGGVGGGGAGGGGIGFGFVGGGLMDSPEESAPAKNQPATHVKTSPSEIAKIDPTVANSVLRKEGVLFLRPLS